MEGLRYVQINLQHNKAATALLARALKGGKFDIALIQEPYIYKGEIKGLDDTGGTIWNSRNTNNGVRTCIYTRNGVNAWPLHDFCYRDLTAVKINTGGKDSSKTIISAAVYLPYEEPNPIPTQLEGLVNHSIQHKMDIIIGCDANAHHVIWGSSDTNRRGEKVLEYLVSSPLQLLNRGNSPTFVNARRDTATIRRNPKHTDWVNYSKDLKILLGDPKCKLNSTLDIELEADRLSKTITQAWTDNCPAKEIKPKKVPWWNKELEALKRETRIAFNRAKARNDYSDYSKKLTEYHKAVRKSKRKSWTDHCGLISSLPESMRLTKALSLAKESPLTSIKNKDGKLTESGEETLRIMATEHFPGSTIINIMTDEDITHR
ncbi:uncharacterized protein LOC142985841 [Anticarsia gemmatalis]|uniref:uncharacterized protein LOC142985841 n=1 Tax=Anticarsia gemmatalis TaxID=129554 RepID=UPI003F778246